MNQNRGKSRRYVFRSTLEQVRRKNGCLVYGARLQPILCLDKKKIYIYKAIHSLLNIWQILDPLGNQKKFDLPSSWEGVGIFFLATTSALTDRHLRDLNKNPRTRFPTQLLQLDRSLLVFFFFFYFFILFLLNHKYYCCLEALQKEIDCFGLQNQIFLFFFYMTDKIFSGCS